ncbi:MAG TPA: alpha/beta hydrolase [Pyrinomonadaceae bacterium]
MKRYILTFLVVSLFAASVSAQDAQEGFILTPDEVRIFYKIVGSGANTLVMVHGGPGNSLESIRADMEPLAKGRRVIYYDQRGQGRSELIKDGKKLAYEYHIADLEALRQHFKLEKMKLFGNSWGGLMASLYAVAHPDRVERMVLHHPASPTRGFLDDMDDEISRRMPKIYKPEQIERAKKISKEEYWLQASDPVAVCREFFTMVLTTYTYSQTLNIPFKGDVCAGPKESVRQWRTTNRHMWASLGDFNLMPKLAAVKAPVLVIHGAADVIPLRSSEFWAYGYPNARLFLIEKSGHISQAETPEILFPAVETFLQGTFPAQARIVVRKW